MSILILPFRQAIHPPQCLEQMLLSPEEFNFEKQSQQTLYCLLIIHTFCVFFNIKICSWWNPCSIGTNWYAWIHLNVFSKCLMFIFWKRTPRLLLSFQKIQTHAFISHFNPCLTFLDLYNIDKQRCAVSLHWYLCQNRSFIIDLTDFPDIQRLLTTPHT